MRTATGRTTTSTKLPTIALDYTPAHEQGGGIGRLVRELVDALAREDGETAYRLFVARSGKPLPDPPGDNFQWRPAPLSNEWLARVWHRARLPLPVDLITGPVDLFHATDFVLPPTRSRTRTLLTVHDLSFVRTPETALAQLRRYLNAVVPRSVARADHVLADSAATKRDLIDLYGTPADKITVLLSGVNPRFRPATTQHVETVIERYELPRKPFIMGLGTVQPRKNYPRLIQSVSRLREMNHDIALVIVGGRGWLTEEIDTALEQHNMREHVVFPGFVVDDDLPALYTAATVFAFPSLYEGFGLPILEAMACGTPVLTANVSSLPEVAGDAAYLVGDPTDTDAITHGLATLLADSDLRTTLIARGHEQVTHFTWGKAAKHLRSIYTRLLL